MKKQMPIGIVGPCRVIELEEWLAPLPKGSFIKELGMGGQPVVSLVQALLKIGEHVILFTLDEQLKSTDKYVIKGERLTIIVLPVIHSKFDTFIMLRRRTISVLKFHLLKYECRIYHAHWTGVYARAVIKSKKNYLISVHDWHLDFYKYIFKQNKISTTYNLIEQLYVCLTMKRYVAVSPYILDCVRRINKNSIGVIPNIITMKNFNQIHLTHKKENEIHTIITINQSFDRLKNVRLLIKSIPEVISSKKVRFIFCGKDFFPNGPAAKYANEKGIPSDVCEFMGALSHTEILKLVAESDLLVSVSQKESFGMTLVEAMSVGTKVLGGVNSGAIPWLLANGRRGYLVDVNSTHSIATGILRSLENLDCAMLDNGRSLILDELSPKKVAVDLLKIYEICC